MKEEEGNGEQIVLYSRELLFDLNSVLKQNVLSPMEQETYVNQMEEIMILLSQYENLTPEEITKLFSRNLAGEITVN